jgi:ArsR family transcriptional regulator
MEVSVMDAKTQALFEARAKVVKALAHPTRLFIVDELSRGKRCVCELTELVEADMSTVSKHLAILKERAL